MKLDNYIIKEGSHSKLIYKKDFEEFLSIPNIRIVLKLIDQIKKDNVEEFVGKRLIEGDLFVEGIGESKYISYFKILYDDKIRFLKDGRFAYSRTGYDEVVWMKEVKERIHGIDNVSVINYKLGYKNEKGRIVTISDMLIGEDIMPLGKFLYDLGVLQDIGVPKTGIEIPLAIGYFFKGHNDEIYFDQLENIDRNIRKILERLSDFKDISTENILIDKKTGKLYLLDLIKS